RGRPPRRGLGLRYQAELLPLARRQRAQRRLVQAYRVVVAPVVAIVERGRGIGVRERLQQSHEERQAVRDLPVRPVPLVEEGGDLLRGAGRERGAFAELDRRRLERGELVELEASVEVRLHPRRERLAAGIEHGLGTLAEIRLRLALQARSEDRVQTLEEQL